jgi:hypothetical protein
MYYAQLFDLRAQTVRTRTSCHRTADQAMAEALRLQRANDRIFIRETAGTARHMSLTMPPALLARITTQPQY